MRSYVITNSRVIFFLSCQFVGVKFRQPGSPCLEFSWNGGSESGDGSNKDNPGSLAPEGGGVGDG